VTTSTTDTGTHTTTNTPADPTTRTVRLDYASWQHSHDPVLDAEAWVGDLDANVQIELVAPGGPAGGHPVLAFTGAPREVGKVLRGYYETSPYDLVNALFDLL
jgi:hypothetical protein